MSTTTPRLGLYKPASDGSEFVNVNTDLNNNYDAIDLAMGHRIVTSSTRPSTPYGGQGILESDTSYRSYLHNGTSPASGGWIEIPNGSATYGSQLWASRNTDATTFRAANTLSTATNPIILGEAAAASGIAYGARVAGDTHDRIRIRADGRIDIGPGTGARDTNLYRSAADTLKTDDNLIVGSTLAVTGAANLGSTLAVGGAATLASTLTLGGDLTLSSGRVFRTRASTAPTTVANTTTETVLATMAIPAGEPQYATYRLKAWGIASNAATTPNIVWRARIGGLSGSSMAQILYTFGSASSGSRSWSMQIDMVLLTTGASATWLGQLTGVSNINTSTATFDTQAPVIHDGLVAQTKDSTVTQDLVLTATWSAAASANTLTCYGFTAERVS